MSHPTAPNRQVVLEHTTVKFRTFPVQAILSLPRRDLPRLSYLRLQRENQCQVWSYALGGCFVRSSHHDRIQPSPCHLVRFRGQRIPIRKYHPARSERRLDDGLDQIGSGRQVEEQLRYRSDGVLRIEQRLTRDFRGPRATGLSDDDGLHLAPSHAFGKRTQYGGFT